MRLDEFLAENPLPDDAGAAGYGERGPVGDSVTITGRLLGATDDELRVLLGSAVACVPRASVREIDRDPAPPAVEPTSLWVRVQVDATARVRMETTTSAGALTGFGMRPLVAAEPTLAPRYRVPDPIGPGGGRWVEWVGGVNGFGSPLIASTQTLGGYTPAPPYDTVSQTVSDCVRDCTSDTAINGGIQADVFQDHMTDTQTDHQQDVPGIWA